MKRKNLIYILLALSSLFILSLACSQAGEIITPAEATQRYEATQSASESGVVGDAEGAEYLEGEEAILVGQGYLVGLYSNPGDESAVSFATRGDQITVEGSELYEGEVWYRVETIAGSGWVQADSLAPME
ncbi:MAG: hypothetical protein ACK2TT_00840 [Anaerolineales bacterium]|jgi:hypothetical protein